MIAARWPAARVALITLLSNFQNLPSCLLRYSERGFSLNRPRKNGRPTAPAASVVRRWRRPPRTAPVASGRPSSAAAAAKPDSYGPNVPAGDGSTAAVVTDARSATASVAGWSGRPRPCAVTTERREVQREEAERRERGAERTGRARAARRRGPREPRRRRPAARPPSGSRGTSHATSSRPTRRAGRGEAPAPTTHERGRAGSEDGRAAREERARRPPRRPRGGASPCRGPSRARRPPPERAQRRAEDGADRRPSEPISPLRKGITCRRNVVAPETRPRAAERDLLAARQEQVAAAARARRRRGRSGGSRARRARGSRRRGGRKGLLKSSGTRRRASTSSASAQDESRRFS